MTTAYCIPPSVLAWLVAVPADVPVAMLLRHSVRGPLPHGQMGEDVPLTADGEAIAQQLGAILGPRLRMLRTSPVLRCVQTAKAVRLGAESHLGIETSDLWGGPGIYVVEPATAWSNWQTMSHEVVLAHLIQRDDPLPGLARPAEAARQLVQRMLGEAGADPGVHVFVTHDLFVTTTAARMLRQPLGRDAWPWFLEAAFFWRDSGGLHSAYRSWHGVQAELPAAALVDSHVIEFARREIARTVGLDSGARFFLAGGAFKSLLTGRAPRDLDLWAPSPADRQLLVSALLARGARRLPSTEFAEVFGCAGRVVDVPLKTEPATLAERLARFDLGLSAIGVEHRPGDEWSAVVHPRALESVARREVLLLEPLRKSRYAYLTLERMHRYARELGYIVPDAEVDRIRRAMLEVAAASSSWRPLSGR